MKTLTIFILVFLTSVAGWIGVLHALPRPNEAVWIEGIYKKKELVADAMSDTPRIVLVGGSSTHFSFSAEIISRHTGHTVLNFGTHAGLGGEYLLTRAKSSLRPGDTVVLILEHHLLAATHPTTVLATFVATTDSEYLLSAPLRDLPQLLFGYSPMQLVRQSAATWLPRSAVLYRAASVTDFGDESANTPENKSPGMAAAVSAHRRISMALPDRPPRFLAEFTDWARKNGIRLLQAWPAMVDRPDYSSESYTRYFSRYAGLFNELGYTTVGSQGDYLLPESKMLDTLYHADSDGQEKVSLQFARDLCAAIDC